MNLCLVIWFYAWVNFCYCLSYLKEWDSFQKWSKIIIDNVNPLHTYNHTKWSYIKLLKALKRFIKFFYWPEAFFIGLYWRAWEKKGTSFQIESNKRPHRRLPFHQWYELIYRTSNWISHTWINLVPYRPIQSNISICNYHFLWLEKKFCLALSFWIGDDK